MPTSISTYVCLFTLTLSGCASQAEFAALEAENAALAERVKQLEAAPRRAAGPTAAGRQRPDPTRTYAFPVGESAQRGPADAWVTLVIVSDFECPYCSRVRPTLDQLVERYGDDLRLVFKHNPLPMHRNAQSAAHAAECAGEQERFWEMHDALFADQRRLGNEAYAEMAQAIGLDGQRFTECMANQRHAARIRDDQEAAAGLGARGTPAFFINGRFLSGAQPLAAFTTLIDEELAKAKASNVPRGSYYEAVVMAKGARRR